VAFPEASPGNISWKRLSVSGFHNVILGISVVVQAVGRGNEECIDLDLLEWATYT
jgi:hypothetical protein